MRAIRFVVKLKQCRFRVGTGRPLVEEADKEPRSVVAGVHQRSCNSSAIFIFSTPLHQGTELARILRALGEANRCAL